MSAEDWTPMQQLISEHWGMPDDLADELIAGGYVAADNREYLAEVLGQHDECYSEGEHDGRCKCGKWIEYGQYDMPDHLSSVLEDAGLLVAAEPTPAGVVATNWQGTVQRVVKDRAGTTPETREQIAIAICEATEFGRMFPWLTLSEGDRDVWRGVADAAIRAQREASIICTEEQLAALPFLSLVREIYRPSPGSGTDYGGVWERRTSGWHAIAGSVMPPGYTSPRLPARLLWRAEP